MTRPKSINNIFLMILPVLAVCFTLTATIVYGQEKDVKISLVAPEAALEEGKEFLQKMEATEAFSPSIKQRAKDAMNRISKAESRKDAIDILRDGMKPMVTLLQSPEAEILPKAESRKFRNEAAAVSIYLGQYRDGANLAQKVLEQNPDDRDALNNIARSNYGLGNYEGAIRYATRLTQIDPDHGTAYTTRALAHYADGNYLQAIEDAKKALALNKDNEIAFATLKVAESRFHPVRLNLNDRQLAQADSIKAVYQEMLQQSNQAEATKRSPTFTGASSKKMDQHKYYVRAAAKNMAGQYREALEDANMALALDPNHVAARDARAMANVQLGRYRDALEDVTRSIVLDSNNAYAYAIRARIHEKLHDFSAMLADYRIAAQMNPQFEPGYRAAMKTHAPVENLGENPGSFKNPILPTSSKPISGFFRQFPLALGFALLGLFLVGLGISHVFHSPGEMRGLSSNYKIIRLIGEGGMSIVYEGMDMVLRRRVAIKKMKEDWKRGSQRRVKFLQEARIVAALHHPQIVEIYSIVEQGEDLYLVFELVAGRTLEKMLSEKKYFSLIETLPIVRDVCGALKYAHSHGVVHSDLKPSNIMITEEGRAKVMDFGIAHRVKGAFERLTKNQTVIGTPQYMAPEAEQGLVRKEADIYALGVCLYEILTGERPVASVASEYAKASRSYGKASLRVAGLPPEVDHLIDDALHPNADKRIHSAAEFLARFEKIVDSAATVVSTHG